MIEFNDDNFWKYNPVRLLRREHDKNYSKEVIATYYYKGKVYEPEDKHNGLILIEVKDNDELVDTMVTTTPSFEPKTIYSEFCVCDGNEYGPDGGELWDEAMATFDKIVMKFL